MMIKLTKQAVSKLLSQPIQVRLINGLFYESSVVAQFSRYKITLEVAVVHPSLKQFTRIDSPRVQLIYWVAHEGRHIEVPSELTPLVQKMVQMSSISEEQAGQLLIDVREAYSQMFQDLSV